MSDGVPKSRVTLTYDTRQPEGREKPRELPFRLMVLGDLGGSKQDVPLELRRVRQLNGRNLGDVIKGLKIRIPDVAVADNRKLNLLIDSMESFAPDDILRTLTGQKHERPIDASLRSAWGESATPESLWPSDPALAKTWGQREQVVGFQKSYQNSKTLRAALKAFSTQPASKEESDKRQKAIDDMKKQIAAKASTSSAGGATGSSGGGTAASGGGGSAGATGAGPGARGGVT